MVSSEEGPDSLKIINQELTGMPVRIVRKPRRNSDLDRVGAPFCRLCNQYQATCLIDVCSELVLCNRCACEKTPSLCPHCNKRYQTIKQTISA